MRRLIVTLFLIAGCSGGSSSAVVDEAGLPTEIDAGMSEEDASAPDLDAAAGPDATDAGLDDVVYVDHVCSVSYVPVAATVTPDWNYDPSLPPCDVECGAGGAFKYKVSDAALRPDMRGCTQQAGTLSFCCPHNECKRLEAIDGLCAQYHPGKGTGYYCDGPANNLPTRGPDCESYNGPANDAGANYLQWCCPG